MRTRCVQWIGSTMLMLGLAGAAHAQQPRPPAADAQASSAQGGDMSSRCQAMMAGHQKMMAEVKTADQRLDALVTKMEQASGQAKVDAVAAVVAEMVDQRQAMRDRMMQMMQQRMSHMGEHMQAGAASMKGCPMMKMGGMQH